MTYKNSEELHDFFNTNPSEITNNQEVLSLIKTTADFLEQKSDKKEVDLLIIECHALSFTLNKDKQDPLMTRCYDGETVIYPSIELFQEKEFEHINSIFKSTKNEILKSHYGHFLWLNGHKNQSYLRTTVDAYESRIIKLLNQCKSEDSPIIYRQVSFLLRQLIYLCHQTKQTERAKILVIDTLNDPKHEWLFFSLCDLMLTEKKIFKRPDFAIFSQKCLSIISKLEDGFEKIDFLNLGVRIDRKLGTSITNWKRLIADQYAILAKNRSDLAGTSFANRAAKLYKELGEDELFDEMIKLYTLRKNNQNLSSYSREYDITEGVRIVEIIIDDLENQDFNMFISFLTSSQVIPDKATINKLRNEVSKNQNSLRFHIANKALDSNGHTAQHFTTKKEIEHMLLLESYNDTIRLVFATLVDRLMHRVWKNEIWNSKDFLTFLTSSSWYGQVINRPFSKGKMVSYKIIDLIAPSIDYYYMELEKMRDNNDYVPNFTLCIDSLSLKVEGILREICRIIGINILKPRKDNQSRDMMQEKDINMLLREEQLKQFLGEDLILYLQFVLTERLGLNLRNRVAHAFLYPQHYKSFTVMNMLIIAILRLSIGRLIPKNETDNN